MLKRSLKFAGFGFILGIAVCSIITILTSDASGVPASAAFIEKIGSAKWALLIQALLSGIHGAICMGTVTLYDTDRLPLTLVSALHCACCIVPFVVLSVLLGWTGSVADTLIMVGIQLVAYFIVWLIMYSLYRKEIRELNKIKDNIDNSGPENPAE